MAKPLTKSRFKLGLECPTKLYYSNPDNGYYDKNSDNDFLQALADGGIQVGELAKFKYHIDPIGAKITINTLNYDEAVAETEARLKSSGKVVIAEAALRHDNLFVRVDILIHDSDSKTVELIEVKSKSVKQEIIDRQFKTKGTKNKPPKWDAEWSPYLYDVAFQTEVAKKCFPESDGYKIISKLLLLNPGQVADIDGLHQHFKIVYKKEPNFNKKRAFIETLPNLKKEDLGNLITLSEVDVTSVVENLRHDAVSSAHAPQDVTKDLPTFINWISEIQKNGTRFFGKVSKVCKGCQFRADPSQKELSGIHECWAEEFNWGMDPNYNNFSYRDKPLSIDLWGSAFHDYQSIEPNKSAAQAALNNSRAFVADIKASDIEPQKEKDSSKSGMSAFERRMAQINAFNGQSTPYILVEDRLKDMDDWEWPLHMIDFETSAPAIPFFKGMHPYETLAFQFSHHIMEKDAAGRVSIRHANQWISTAAETFPSIDFVRELKEALMPNGELKGTVFRYHNHENTVLRKLMDKIEKVNPEDKDDLLAFIDLVTEVKDSKGEYIHKGDKSMVDLHRLIQEGYYSKHAGGSISLKYILPAILHDAPQLHNLYSSVGVYGKNKKIKSLNFDDQLWLDSKNDPYKTLPPIFGHGHDEINEMLLRLTGNDADDDEGGSINQGGLAMTAYNYTQYACLNQSERTAIEDALLRYCELDTLAMVMLVQGLMELRGNPFN